MTHAHTPNACLTPTSATTSSSTTTTTTTTPTSTTTETSSSTVTSSELLPLTPLALVTTVLGDIIAIIPNFTSLVSSYRLLVGAAEEMQRIPGVPPAYRARAIDRFDQTGTLIDILLELLCCKISFSAELLQVTCAPLDLLRLLTHRLSNCVNPEQLPRQLLELEVLLSALQAISPDRPCVDDFPVQASELPASPPPIIPPDSSQNNLLRQDVVSFDAPSTIHCVKQNFHCHRPRRLGGKQ